MAEDARSCLMKSLETPSERVRVAKLNLAAVNRHQAVSNPSASAYEKSLACSSAPGSSDSNMPCVAIASDNEAIAVELPVMEGSSYVNTDTQ